MSEQLNHTKNSEIVYVDFSKTSMSFAQLKHRIRRTANVVWVISWIENIPLHGLGSFDFVTCTGVLHHLKSPPKGLRILRDIQLPHAGAELMVYGKYGRTGIYQLQDVLRLANIKEKGMIGELSNAKEFLRILPNEHWFYCINNVTDIKMGDIGIYDLLLHKRDVAYSIADLHEWVEQSGYHAIDFSLAHVRTELSPELRLVERGLYDAIVKKSNDIQQHWISELMSGIIIKQDVFVSVLKNAEASLEDLDNMIYAYGSPMGFRNVIDDPNNYKLLRNETFIYATLTDSQVNEMESSWKSNVNLQPPRHGTEFAFRMTKFNKFVVTELTKKPARPKQICKLIKTFKEKTRSNLSTNELTKEVKDLFAYLKQSGVFLLKHKSVRLFPKTCCTNKFHVGGIIRY